MSLIGKLKGLTDVLAWLGKLDPADLPKLIEAFKIVSDPTKELRERVIAGLVVADIATDYIPGDADDAFVAAVTNLLKSDEAWLLIETVKQLLENGGRIKDLDPLKASHPNGMVIGKGKDAQSIPWPVIIKIAGIILSLLAEFADKPADGDSLDKESDADE